MRAALERMELLVSIDVFRNETGNLAHYVLPALSFLERPDLPIAVHGLQPVPYLQYTEAVVEPDGAQRDEWWIFSELARASGLPLFGSRAASALFGVNRLLSRTPLARRLAFSPERMMAATVAASGQTTLSELRRRPSGVLLAPNRGDDYLGRRVLTDDGLVDLAPPDFVAAAREDLPRAFERHRAARGRLYPISKRERFTHNSWMHNVEHFVAGERGTNYLYVHPDDAARTGLRNGAVAEIRTGTGAVRAPVRVTDEMMPGTVALPHGWGHEAADGLRVARSAPGVNPNRLAKSGPSALERFAGMTHLNGIPVDITPAD